MTAAIGRKDAWLLRRLAFGHDLNGELGEVSTPFRPLAEHLAARPIADRQATLDAYLLGHPEAESIVLAMAGVDPTGPAPAPEAGDPVDWPPPALEGLPPVERFPVEVLPPAAARLVREGAEAIGCPADFLGLPALAVAAGAIGRSVSLLLKRGYFAGSTLYAAPVGPPSDGKTPALKAASAPLRRIDEALEAEHARAMERWREESARPSPEGKRAKPPPPPRPRRIDLDDITMEAIPIILADNPRGLVMVRDELSAFVLGMNQYKAGGRGNDRSNALKLWAGDAIKKDRVNHEANIPIRCAHPCLTIVGGLTPDMLGEMVDPKGRSDGFLDRFLLAYPDPRPVAPWSERGVPEETADDWCALVARLWRRPMSLSDGRPVPHVAHFTPEGRARWASLYNAHVAEMNRDDFAPRLRGPWGKFREYAGRLALVLACLDHASDPTADPEAVPRVGPEVVEDAWRLIDYFKSHARRVHATIGRGPGGGGGPVAKAVVDWLRAGHRASFTEHEVKQARRWIDPAELADALAHLAARHAIRPRPRPTSGPKGGRPASPSYDVNPALLETRNPTNPRFPGPAGGEGVGSEGSEGSESSEY